MKEYTALSTQTVVDLALQLTGNADSAIELIKANPSLDNLEADPTGKVIKYEINNTVTQRTYISQDVIISNKPKKYLNEIGTYLAVDEFTLLVQNNGYEILV